MLSQKCKYAIRAIVFIASAYEGEEKVGLKELSASLKLPAPYLGKILQELVSMKVISSHKGPTGGFYLTHKNRAMPVMKIIEAVDGLGFFDSCGLGLRKCSGNHPCPLHNDFKVAREQLRTALNKKTVTDLAQEIENKTCVLVL